MESGWQLNKGMVAALSPSLPSSQTTVTSGQRESDLVTPDRWTADRMDPPPGPRPCAAVSLAW